MKKLLIIALFYVCFTVFAVNIISSKGETMYVLNWGEYIDPSLIEEFEEINSVSVELVEVGSSEEMYQQISAGTTKYDIAVPSDYTIEKMYNNNMLYEIDFDLLENYNDDLFNDDLEILRNDFFENNQSYAMPYFWGSYAIIYSTLNENLESIIKTNELDVLFDRSILPTSTKVGMYDIARWAVTAYLLSEGLDVNTSEFSDDLINEIVSAISSMDYDLWADDLLKKQVANGNLDIAFVQLGDFFDQYYVTLESGGDINFSCHIPTNTAAFFDGLVIPKTAANVDLAHKFIDFFLTPDVAFQNASYVGYSPTLKSVIELIEEDEDFEEMLELYPFYLNPTMYSDNVTLFRDLGTDYQTVVDSIINRAKV